MPYPYSNDLGKKPPPKSKAARAKEVAPFIKPKASPEELAKLDAILQQKMMDQLFGAKPSTIKFPHVVPKIIKKDFPGDTKANDYGKADTSAIPEWGPAKTYEDQAKFMQAMLQEGMLKKEELYDKLYKGKVLGEFEKNDPPMPKPFIYEYNKSVEAKPAQPPYAFSKQDPFQPNSYIIKMKFEVEGIEGLDGQVLYANQTVSKAFMYGSPQASEVIMKDMMRQIQEMINDKLKGK